MIIIRIIHTIVLYLLAAISFFIGTFSAIFLALFTKNKVRPFQIAAKGWSQFLGLISGIRISAKGLKNIPKNRAVILISNHQGNADIPILLAKLPLLFNFVIKKELFKVPFFGWYLRKTGYLSIDRSKGASAFKTLDKAEEMLKTGESILIFPEGSRTRDGAIGPFKRGSLVLAIKSGVPVIPIAINGSFKVQRAGSFLFYPAKIKLSVGKPIKVAYKKHPTKQDQERELNRIRDAIIGLLED